MVWSVSAGAAASAGLAVLRIAPVANATAAAILIRIIIPPGRGCSPRRKGVGLVSVAASGGSTDLENGKYAVS